jgi:protein TonB
VTLVRHAPPHRQRAATIRQRAKAIGSSVTLHALLLAGAAVAFVAHAPSSRPPVIAAALRPAVEAVEDEPPAPVIDPVQPERTDEELLPETAELELPEPEFDAPECAPRVDPQVIELRSASARFGADARVRSRRPRQAPVADAAPPREPALPAVALAITASPTPPAAVEPPRPRDGNAAPPYPPRAERRGWAGAVRLAIEVDAAGTVVDVRVVESSGFAVLDEAARAAALAWRYEPATRGGARVAFTLHRTIRFEQ